MSMYYYGNPYGYGSSGNCCGIPQTTYCSGGTNMGQSYAIVLVLFILLIIILGARAWN